jgi:tetratricopeptide (TPR) repeat protein
MVCFDSPLLAQEPETRPSLYTKAIESFEKAIEIAPAAYEGHYYLALQQAEMRDVSKAIVSVKQSLGLNSAHIPSWHLLVLLLSAQKDYERALSICAVGLKESDWDLPQTDGFSASQLDGEDYLALRITQAALIEQINGAEAALEPQEALFVLYTKVFAAEPSSLGESLYDIQNIRRRDQSDIEINTSSTVVGRPRAGSILSVRSKSGTSDIGQGLGASNGSNLGKTCLTF